MILFATLLASVNLWVLEYREPGANTVESVIHTNLHACDSQAQQLKNQGYTILKWCIGPR